MQEWIDLIIKNTSKQSFDPAKIAGIKKWTLRSMIFGKICKKIGIPLVLVLHRAVAGSASLQNIFSEQSVIFQNIKKPL